jgi:histidine ammonia-lyase
MAFVSDLKYVCAKCDSSPIHELKQGGYICGTCASKDILTVAEKKEWIVTVEHTTGSIRLDLRKKAKTNEVVTVSKFLAQLTNEMKHYYEGYRFDKFELGKLMERTAAIMTNDPSLLS